MARLPAETAPLGGVTFPVLFSPDNGAVATSIGGALKLWDTSSWQLRTTIASVSDGKRNALAWSPDGKIIASCYANRIRFWDLESRVQIGESADSVNQPYALAFDSTGSLLAVADSSGKLKLIDVATRATVDGADAHSGFVQGVAFARDGNTLATCGADQLIHVWKLKPLKKVNTLSGHQNEVWAIAFVSDGQTLASASKDGTAKLWSVDPGPAPQTTLTNTVMPLWFSADGQVLMTRSLDGSTHYWEVASGRHKDALPALRIGGTRYANAVSSNGITSASGLHNGRVEIWNLEKRAREASYEVDSNPAVVVKFSPDEKLLAVATGQYVRGRWQGGTKLIDLATGRMDPLTSDYSGTQDQAALAFSPD